MLSPEEIDKVRNGVRGRAAREMSRAGAGGKEGLRLMWNKSGEEIPVPGDVMRRFLGTMTPVEPADRAIGETQLDDGWGEVDSEASKVDSLDGGDSATPNAAAIEEALARDRARLARHAAALVTTTRRGIPGGLGTVLPESARLAQLAETMARRHAIESGAEEADEAFRARTRGMTWWAQRAERRKRDKPVEEAIEREVERQLEGDLSPWGKPGRGRSQL
jgi:hypothetical protein